MTKHGFNELKLNKNILLDDESINMDVKSESSDDDIFYELEGENMETSPKKTNGTAATNDSESDEENGDEEMDYSD